MANIKDLIKSIEAADSSFDEKLAAINQMEETLVSMRAQEEQAVQDNVDLIVEAIKVMERKVESQLEIAKSIVPEKGDKGDKGERGLDGKNGVDGKDGRDGINGRDGQDGQDGVSVTDAKIDFDGSLIITLSTGQEINVGEVVAPELQEKIKLVTSGGAGTVLPSQTGNANKYLKTDGSGLSWDALNGSDIDLSSPPTIGNTTPNTGAFTTLSASSTVSGTGFSTYLASPPAIGGTTPAAGTFTTLIGGGGSANYGQLTGGATTKAVEFQTLGSDSNISLVLDTKGTGAIDLAAGSSGVNISNGGTVTAITRTAAGSAYTSIPSVAITAPTTAGGVQATATVAVFVNAGTVASGGTGYTVGDVLTIVGGTFASTAATLTVATVSSGVITAVTVSLASTYTATPTNPVSVTGGTGSGATFNLTYGTLNTFTITNAGSGYVEQPTVTFSGGGGSGATAYATVGSVTTIKSIGASTTGTTLASIQFVTPNTANPNYPPLTIRDIANSDTGLIVSPNTGYAQLFAGNASNSILMLGSAGTSSIYFNTQGSSQTNQMRVSHTASAVNYVQVTGSATTQSTIISTQGSDASVGMFLRVKGNPVGPGFRVENNNGSNICFAVTTSGANVANYLRADPAAAGSAAGMSSQGTDTDIDLTLTPKGTGNIRFGTYTASVLTPTGYITIKDSGGTTRRLLVG